MSITSVDRRSGRLPAELTSFVGRRGELAEIERLFVKCRLVTLMGPGGVGKTRLAVRAAAALAPGHEDGVCFVDLSTLRRPSLLPQAVGSALGLPDTDADPGAALDNLVACLGDRAKLLVLDTCEHLVDACALLAEVLLRSAPGLRVLATSRQPLDIAGEYTLVVEPLASPDPERYDGAEPCDSVSLFAERAGAVVPGWSVTDANRAAVALLCRRLDGIPLALELAAVQLRALPVEQIVDRLDRRILHVRGRRTSMPRHQTLQAAIDWSHDLCSPDERLLWERLSVFVGDFDLEAAEQVCADRALPAAGICELLAGLVAKSVVRRADAGGAARYRMLDTIREYGAERLDRAGAGASVRMRAFAHFAGRITAARARLMSEDQPRLLAWFGMELPNIRALMDHGLHDEPDESIATMALGLGRMLALRGRIGEARHWYRQIIAGRDIRGPLGTETLALAGLLAVMQDDPGDARDLLAAAERRAEDAGDVSGLAYARQAQGVAALFADDLPAALRRLGDARELHERAGNDDVLVCITDVFRAVVCTLMGDTAAALEHAIRAVEETGASGEQWCHSYALCVAGLALVLAGRPEDAEPDLRRGLAIKRSLDDRLGVSLALDMLAACRAARGDGAGGARLFAVADRLRRFTGTSMFGPQHHLLRAAYEAQAREALGDAAFRDGYESGRCLDMDAAIAEALGELAAAPPAAAEPEADPQPLTPRELEIAGLVAQGLTNREIADRLVIAKRTADSHVEHILAKLAFSSRAQIAAWSVRRS
ncbi:ATP-binding protein [Actinomadura parmotrematis]|uniref:LuxR C-terminal-related transcriptional regulator n=1 Tax=Actinomadura parmotrematis TaxID=2864039 RepID=A0ABS7G5K9_9ACTN|nr:LuxR C-terminal-related transcriptional regulator [Actinomadura parmotrematis]MBW8487164.1 LuxR C-terminal-related transcriptional regulator [Actinomadura parmotrematis]